MSATDISVERRWTRICFIVSLFIAGALLLWQLQGLLLLIFAGVLIAILLDAAARWLSRFLRIPKSAGVIVVAVTMTALLMAGTIIMGPGLIEQGTKLAEDLAGMTRMLEQKTMAIDAVEEQFDKASVDLIKMLPSPAGLLGGVTAVLGATLGAIANVALILVFAVYFALAPETYRNGFRRLTPPSRRDQVDEMLVEMGTTLRHWLAGKALMMVLLGIGSYVGLTLLGVPLALLLSVIAGATSFVPIIGPAIAGGLMILVAMTVSWQLAAWTVGLYVLLQAVESYLLMPIIQSRAIDLPAAVVIAAQVMFGVLFGALGVALATPIAAIAAVAIRCLYIETILESETETA